MRHDQHSESYRRVDMPAIRPASPLVSPAPIPEAVAVSADSFVPTPIAPDVPQGAWIALVASYFAMIGVFALAAAGTAQSIYLIAAAALFMVSLFATPWLLFRQEPRRFPLPAFEAFLQDGIDTINGRCSGGAALLQMLIVPVLLTFGAIGMAISAAIFL